LSEQKTQDIGFFEKYLTLWVLLCMGAGILIGKFLPGIPAVLEKFQYAGQNLPIAVLIWVMIYPMMMKIDFQSIKNVGKRPWGILISSGSSWLIKPFLMFGLATLFFKVIFQALIPAGLAQDFVTGAVLLGVAPCTAMVFVWSALTKGDPAHTLVQVSVNDLIILVLCAVGAILVRGKWRCHPVGYPRLFRHPVRRCASGWRRAHSLLYDPEKGRAVFQ